MILMLYSALIFLALAGVRDASACNMLGLSGGVGYTSPEYSSPSHPSVSPHNLDCLYKIDAQSSSNVIKVTFNPFNLENHVNCAYDYVAVYEGPTTASRLLGKYCGPKSLFFVTGRGRYMYMHYHTDASIPSNGFRFRFSISASASPSCDQLTIGGGPGTGFITSPGYPTSYPHHADCRYRIDAGRSDRPITLTFTAFHLEDHSHCIYDYIEIRNGSEGNWSPNARKYCGTTAPAPLVIIGQRYVYIRFLSDVSVSGNGFQIQYNISDNSAPLPCTSTFNVRYTVHTSPLYYTPGYPNHSPHSLDCSYRINTPSGSDIIRVHFQYFNLERHTACQYDYVAVYEGPNESSRLIGKYCGQNTSFVVTGRAPNMFIRYRTDDTVPSSGFRFTFRTWVRPASTPASCDQLSLGGGTGMGYITSPNYPNTYPRHSDCRYRINAGSSNRMITLKFTSFNVETNINCNHDYVDVRLGSSGNWSPTSRRYCGIRPLPHKL
ncbi:cubilin-like [Ciona intestinalis]